MDKKQAAGSGFKIKVLFKIEFIFIYIAVLNFGFSIGCKTYTNKKIANLNSQMIKIQLEENSGIFNHQNLIQKLEYDYEPFTYFDSELKAELSQILTLMGENKSTIEPIITMNEEQSKISRNLHDGVAQDLAALKLYL